MAKTVSPMSEADFLADCEEVLKDRFTEKDEEFVKVFNSEIPTPPIVESWWVPNRSRNNWRPHHRTPYERRGGGGGGGRSDYRRDERSDYRRDRPYHDRRGYNDYEDRGQRYDRRPRY